MRATIARWGNSTALRLPKAIVEELRLKPGQQVAAEALIAHSRELIANYKSPRSIEFRDALPLTGAGKIQKTELRKPFWEGRERNVG